MCLSAASGTIPNVEVAVRAAGCLPTQAVFRAAAAAGQCAVCEWLLQRGCPHDGALQGAAMAGRRDMCEWLIGQKGDSDFLSSLEVLEAATRGGHVGLLEWLLRAHPDRFRLPAAHVDSPCMLAAVAEGCDLATVQRLHREWLGAAPQQGGGDEQQQPNQQLPDEFSFVSRVRITAAAAGSPTPDWRAKVEWLEGRGYPRAEGACEAAAACPDAVERLTWLRGRGYAVRPEAVKAAARAGNVATLQYLHAEGVQMGGFLALEAAWSGHLAVVAWLAEAPGVGVEFTEGFLKDAAVSGNLELLAWLRERGCPWGEDTFFTAARAGSEAALEWLAERGCPMGGGSNLPYLPPVFQQELATLRCLARLGCTWGPPGEVFDRAVMEVSIELYTTEMLKVLLEAGCPIDWEAAEATVVMYCRACGADHGRAEEVLALLAEERARRGG